MPLIYLYNGGRIAVPTSPATVASLLSITDRGYKIMLMRAAKANVGTTYLGNDHYVTLSSTNANGFLDSGEAISYDHPRPDAMDTFILGTTGDYLHVVILAESLPEDYL